MFAESIQAVITQTLLKKRAGGRIAALEILIGTPAVRNLIREGKIHQIPSAMQTGQKVGMQTLDMSLIDLVRRNLVSVEEAQSRTLTPNLFASAAAEPPKGSAQPSAPSPASARETRAGHGHGHSGAAQGDGRPRRLGPLHHRRQPARGARRGRQPHARRASR